MIPLFRVLLNLPKKNWAFRGLLRGNECAKDQRVQQQNSRRERCPSSRQFLVFGGQFFWNAFRFFATSRERINIWSCACSAMLVAGYASPRRTPWGMCLRGQLARRVWGLQGYSEPWLATSTPVTRARTITHIAARCTPRIRDESRRALPGSLGMKIGGNNSRDVMSSFVPAQKYNRAGTVCHAKMESNIFGARTTRRL